MHTCCSSNSPPLPAISMDAVTATQCHWSLANEDRMINFLCSKKEAAADGANFKVAVWNVLVVEMVLHHEIGAPKTVKACKSKYAWVSMTSKTP